MIHLTLSGAVHAPDITLEIPHVRIFGGTVWDRLELGVVAKYAGECWERRSVPYQHLLFEGDFRLLFGLIRDPSPISEPLQLLTLCGPMMYLHEVPFAEYVPAMEMWRGTAESRLWWPSFHLISADFVSNDGYTTETGAEAQDSVELTVRSGLLPRRPV